VGLLDLDQPGDVRLDRVQGVKGDEGAGQVEGFEQGPEVGGVGLAAQGGAKVIWSFSARPPSELTVRVSPQ
jgi:hypothetical protein